MLEVLKPDSVVITPALSRVSRSLAKVTVCHLFRQMKVLTLFGRGAGNEVVENVEVPLSRWGCRDTVPFEVIIQGFDSAQAATFGELEFGIFSKPRSVGIEESASVAKTLENELRGGNLDNQL